MSDITQRLREHNDERLYAEADLLMCDAADEIESVRRQRVELLAALKAYQEFHYLSEEAHTPEEERRMEQLVTTVIAKVESK